MKVMLMCELTVVVYYNLQNFQIPLGIAKHKSFYLKAAMLYSNIICGFTTAGITNKIFCTTVKDL